MSWFIWWVVLRLPGPLLSWSDVTLGWDLFFGPISFTQVAFHQLGEVIAGNGDPKWVVNVWDLLRVSPRRQHSPGFLKDPTLVAEENEKQPVIFLVCLSVYLYLCIAYILSADSVLDVRVGGAGRERYCGCGWYLSVAPSPGGTRVTQSTLCWGYTVRCWWEQGEGGRPWPQTSETPDLLQFSGTSHGRPPGRVMVPTSLCMWVGFSRPLAALAEVWSTSHSHWPRCPELGENSTDTGGTSK